MALLTNKGSYVPEGAVRLTREEALAHQKGIIRDWPSEIDVAFIRYGKHITAAACATSSFLIVNYFKNVLMLGNKSFFLTFVPSILIPTAITYKVTDRVLTENVLLMKMSCPICSQLKLAVCQLYTGMVFPSTYGFFSYINVASATKSYYVPNIKTNSKEFWKMAGNIFKQGAVRFQVGGLIHTLVILFLPYLQAQQLSTVMDKIQKGEAKSQLDFPTSVQSPAFSDSLTGQ